MQALVVGLKLTTTHMPKACGSLAGAFGASQPGLAQIVPGPQSLSGICQKGSGDKHLGGGEGACTDLCRASPRRAGPEGVQVDLGSTPSLGSGPTPGPLGRGARKACPWMPGDGPMPGSPRGARKAHPRFDLSLGDGPMPGPPGRGARKAHPWCFGWSCVELSRGGWGGGDVKWLVVRLDGEESSP